MNLDDTGAVQSREDLVAYLRSLAAASAAPPECWENTELPRYLEAMSAWIGSMDGWARNQGRELPDQPMWSMVADILRAARAVNGQLVRRVGGRGASGQADSFSPDGRSRDL
ncbi:hypothetical protein, partial [Micromonospora sp. LOL_023]|uniref:DUF7660 family protein n=1 Tax=Micromonospora sp. LOL_023 TaxID=3345418 RepID=UPI003A8A5CE7